MNTTSLSINSYSFPSLICVDDEYGDNNYITLSINNQKNIFSIGYSKHKANGHKDGNIFPMKQIQGLMNIKMISCGNFFSICLNYDGDIFYFGNIFYGVLGTETVQTYIPQKINLPPCKQISCGHFFTICLTEDNTLFSFGHNNDGELGLGNNIEFYSSPQLISDLINIEYTVCGAFHSICKTYNNEFYSWGNNDFGQLGQGHNKSCNKPIQCLNWPDNIIDIKCGNDHVLLLTSEGQIYSFGANVYGQLGINDTNIAKLTIQRVLRDIPEIKRIECGGIYSMCIDINNSLWIFGGNYSGQLGLGDTDDRHKPILHPTLSNIMDISSGGEHTFVKTFDNKIYAFGKNNHSQLGIETKEENQLTPIQVFKDKEDIWYSTIGRSKAKSARK